MIWRHQSRSERFAAVPAGMAAVMMLGGCALLENQASPTSGATSLKDPSTELTYSPFSGSYGTIRDTKEECISPPKVPADCQQRDLIGGQKQAAVYVPAGAQAKLNNLALDNCPTETRQASEIIKAIRDAPSCKASFNVMRACRFDAAGDAQLAGVVLEKCQATFMDRLSPDRKVSYQSAREACVHKYTNMQGTIYASYQATCEAAVAVAYAFRWGSEPGQLGTEP